MKVSTSGSDPILSMSLEELETLLEEGRVLKEQEVNEESSPDIFYKVVGL